MDKVSEINKKNQILIIVLWSVVLLDLLINISLNELEIVKQVALFTFFPLIISTLLIIKKKSPKLIKYLIAFVIIGTLFFINSYRINYVNLFFLFTIPLFSLLYREWKFILYNCIGSGFLFCYFILKQGENYFVGWITMDVIYFFLLLIAFYVILIVEAWLSENIRTRLDIELKEIKKLQKNLSYNEMRYRSMLKQSTEGIYAFNPETKKIIEASQHFCKMIGYTEKEILNKTIFDIIDHDSVSIHKNIETSLHSQDNFVGERKYKCKDGKVLDVEVRATVIQTESENVILVNIRDITEMLKNEFELRLSKNILDYILDGAVVTNLDGKIIYVNPSFEKITGYHLDEIMGKTLSLLKSNKHNQEFYNSLWNELNTKGLWEGEMINKKKNGSFYVQRTQIHTIFDNNKQPLLYSSVFRDITSQKEAELKLKEANEVLGKLSKLDGLTGIPNRRFYDETLEMEWSYALHHSNPLSLIMLDIDHFKIYNDTYGHLQGDECLKQVANALRSCLNRNGDFIARYGGEEFSVILPNTDIEGAAVVAEIMRSKIESLNIEHIHSKVKPILTISLGISAIVPTETTSPKALIEQADRALYQAKNSGRNKVGKSFLAFSSI